MASWGEMTITGRRTYQTSPCARYRVEREAIARVHRERPTEAGKLGLAIGALQSLDLDALDAEAEAGVIRTERGERE